MKGCLFTTLLLFSLFFANAQDTLILKPKRKNLPDTIVVKLLRIESEHITSYPFEKFHFTAKDSIAITNKKPIVRRGEIKLEMKDLIAIKYDDKLKHTVFFNDHLARRRKKQEFYNQKKNIVSVGGGVFSGPISLSIDNFHNDFTYADYHETHFSLIQLSYEKIIGNGSLGLRAIPLMIGINGKLFGAGAGFRFYPLKQLQPSLYLGTDFIFNNNTVSRRANPVDTANIYIRSLTQNRNQLLINPFQAGLLINTNSNYVFDLGFSIGPNLVLGSREVTINNEPYKINRAPAFVLARLMIGKKF